MSIQAIVWVLDQSDVDWHLMPVLIALANHTDRDGRAAFPSQENIARESHKSVASVKRDLVKLEEAKLIRRGDQRLVLHRPTRRRPIVWDLAMTPAIPIAQPEPSPIAQTEIPIAQNGDSDSSLLSYKPSLNRPLDPSKELSRSFAEFWAAYPRKIGKPKAQAAYRRALTRATADQITHAAKQLRDQPGREDKYTPHPTTWLNRDGWNDEITPARTSTYDPYADVRMPWEGQPYD